MSGPKDISFMAPQAHVLEKPARLGGLFYFCRRRIYFSCSIKGLGPFGISDTDETLVGSMKIHQGDRFFCAPSLGFRCK